MNLLQTSVLASSLLFASHACAAAAGEQPFYLHSGDTVVFYGDSITDQRLYTMITELYAVTRYPKLNVKYVHSGWGGDRVSGGGGGPIDVRLQRDVFAYQPTVVTIMLGMNDGHYVNHTPEDDDVFYSGYRHIVDSIHQYAANARITAIEPSPFDDVTRPFTLQPGGYNAVLVKYSEWLRDYALANHLVDANFNAPVVQMLQRANAANPEKSQKILPDRVHPGLPGHLVMAEQLLKAWNARPVVSAVTIDSAEGKVVRSQYTQITDFHGGGPLVWTELDEALPLPLADLESADRDGVVALAVRSSDITQALNQQPLQITGLKPGRYKLTIDGDVAGTWTNTELAQGLNLAEVVTPMSKQALQVRDLTVRHLDIHQFRWRTLQVPLGDAGIDRLPDSLRNLDDIEKAVVERQRAAAQPHPHVFQLIPAA